MNFNHSVTTDDLLNLNLRNLGVNLTSDQAARLQDYRRYWDMYEGYHWQQIEESDDAPELTENYCRAFVDKFVRYEFGKGFSIALNANLEKTLLPFVNSVWDDMNDRMQYGLELGQSKSITGDGWTQVQFIPATLGSSDNPTPNPAFDDPYEEFPKGRIQLKVIPTAICFPVFDEIDLDRLVKFTVMYPISNDPEDPSVMRTKIYRQIWTREKCEIWEDDKQIGEYANDYGIIPFFHTKNVPLSGSSYGVSDLADLVSLNIEYNIKNSDVSEIVDYHASPITVITGARMEQLERGANKVWGGLPTGAKVENLELKGDLGISTNYLSSLKQAMHEIGGVPEMSLGANTAISNTSGIALQLMMLPLTEKIETKRAYTTKSLIEITKFIIKIGIAEGLIDGFDSTEYKSKDLYHVEITFEDSLPKDEVATLQAIQYKMKMGLIDREGALKELGAKNIQQLITEIDADRKAHPDVYGIVPQTNGENMPSNNVNNQGQGSAGGIIGRPLGVNKAGNDGQVNAGYQNSSKPSPSTNS